MSQQIPLDPRSRADDPKQDAARGDATREVLPDLAYRRLAIVNVMFYGPRGAGDRNWVLIDAGVFGTMSLITSAAEERFGKGARPAAIVLTHGHFDHVGVLEDLAERWQAPVYAHELERPYLDGSASYPPPDPSVGGGLMARLSPLYPRAPVNVGRWLRTLPADGSVPEMPGWRWLHTPGHSPGHVSFWREADRTIVAGDAFITTGDLVVNLDQKTVEVGGARVHLTGKEYQMLELLSLRKGTTLTKEMFLNHLYGGMDEPELKIIDVFICKLRKKLANASSGKNYIETVWGRGYVLREPGASDERIAV